MKRITLMAMGVLLCCLIAAPSMALDLDFSGQYRVRGFYNDKVNMGKVAGDSGDASFADMRFRLQTVFKVNDNVSVTTRFDALDNRQWGDRFPGYQGAYALQSGSADSYPNDQANVTFDRAYMTIKTPIGGFLAGRMKDNAWGTSFGDTEGNGDRLIYVVPVKNWIFAAVYEKWHEVDGDPNNQNVGFSLHAPQYGSDMDNDKYYLSATFKSQNFTTGLLYGYYRVNSFLDVGSASHATGVDAVFSGVTGGLVPFAPSADLYRRPVSADAHLLSPYIVGRWGDFELQAEGTLAFGKAKYEQFNSTAYAALLAPQLGTAAANAIATSVAALPTTNNNGQDRDIDLGQFMLDATYHIGAFAINAGYAYQSGGYKWNTTQNDKVTAFGVIEASGDWHKMWILNGGNRLGDDNGMFQTLGGIWNPNPIASEAMGNTGNFQGVTSINGFHSYWGAVDWAIQDNMTLGALVGYSEADKVATGWEKKHGVEYDLNFIWDVYENLTWRITYAYLDAGDYWKAGSTAPGDLEDPYTLYTNVSVNF